MSTISPQARQELVAAVTERYQRSTPAERGRILDEFVALTGYHRKHAIRVLNGSSAVSTVRRGRRSVYDEAVTEGLVVLWEASDRVCGKRLKALLPTLVPALERHGSIRHDEVQTTRGASQPITDTVLHRVLEVHAQRADVLRFEERKPRERMLQRVLDQIAGVDVAAHPLRQATPRPPPEPGPAPLEQRVDGRPTAPARPLEETLLRRGVAGSRFAGALRRCRCTFFRRHDSAYHASQRWWRRKRGGGSVAPPSPRSPPFRPLRTAGLAGASTGGLLTRRLVQLGRFGSATRDRPPTACDLRGIPHSYNLKTSVKAKADRTEGRGLLGVPPRHPPRR